MYTINIPSSEINNNNNCACINTTNTTTLYLYLYVGACVYALRCEELVHTCAQIMLH